MTDALIQLYEAGVRSRAHSCLMATVNRPAASLRGDEVEAMRLFKSDEHVSRTLGNPVEVHDSGMRAAVLNEGSLVRIVRLFTSSAPTMRNSGVRTSAKPQDCWAGNRR